MALTDKLTAIADAVRNKTGKTDKLSLDNIVEEINGLPSGKKTVTVTVTGEFYNSIYYMDENGLQQKISSNGQTVETLFGVITKASTAACDIECSSNNIYKLNTGAGEVIFCTEDETVIESVRTDGGGSVD